jgi:hypothetical protein
MKTAGGGALLQHEQLRSGLGGESFFTCGDLSPLHSCSIINTKIKKFNLQTSMSDLGVKFGMEEACAGEERPHGEGARLDMAEARAAQEVSPEPQWLAYVGEADRLVPFMLSAVQDEGSGRRLSLSEPNRERPQSSHPASPHTQFDLYKVAKESHASAPEDKPMEMVSGDGCAGDSSACPPGTCCGTQGVVWSRPRNLTPRCIQSIQHQPQMGNHRHVHPHTDK